MQRYGLVPLFTLLLGSLSGCASISQEECLLGDWYQIGLSDGQNGRSNRAADYSKDCSEYQVKMDLKSYNKGRSEGIKTYCSYDNGVLLGQSNQRYSNVCPAELSSEFLSGYLPYKNLASAQYELRKSQSNIDYYQGQLMSETISENGKKNATANLNTAKMKLEKDEVKVRKYQQELEIHKIQREKSQILAELSGKDISNSRREQLNQRLSSLNTQEAVSDGVSTVESAIQGIKKIADMF